jgi:hypothetical protein
MASFATKGGIFHIKRWHVLLQKMASFATKDGIFCMGGKKDTDER